MSPPKKETVAGRASATTEPSPGPAPPTALPAVRWLAAPRKRPIVLGLLALGYLVWLLALAWMAARAL